MQQPKIRNGFMAALDGTDTNGKKHSRARRDLVRESIKLLRLG